MKRVWSDEQKMPVGKVVKRGKECSFAEVIENVAKINKIVHLTQVYPRRTIPPMLFLYWLNEVRKELRALVTGSLLLFGLGIYQTTTTRVVPPWIYGAVVAVFLGWAFFGAWDKKNRQWLAAAECVSRYRERATALIWISEFADEANGLVVNAPNEDGKRTEIIKWRKRVEAWKSATADALSHLSPVAVDRFSKYDITSQPGDYVGSHREVWSDLALLDEKRRNLTEIMEKADVYLTKLI
jgi:hypothetical protein